MHRMIQNTMFQSDTGRDHDGGRKESPDEDNKLKTYHSSTRIKHKQCNNQKRIIPQCHTSCTLSPVTNTKFVFSFKCSHSKSKFTVSHSKLLSNIHGFTSVNILNKKGLCFHDLQPHNYQQADHFAVVFLHLLFEKHTAV